MTEFSDRETRANSEKAALGQGSALDRIRFRRLFHLDCEYGEIVHLDEWSPKRA
jgi:hypothetical protein